MQERKFNGNLSKSAGVHQQPQIQDGRTPPVPVTITTDEGWWQSGGKGGRTRWSASEPQANFVVLNQVRPIMPDIGQNELFLQERRKKHAQNSHT